METDMTKLSNQELIETLRWYLSDPYYNEIYESLINEIQRRLDLTKP